MPAAGFSPRGVLAGEQAAVQGEERQQAQAEALARRDDLVLDASIEQAVLVLRADEPGQVGGPRRPVRVRDLPAGEVGVAQVADLAGADQVVQRGQRLVDRGARVGLVHLVEVDVVGPQPAQRRLEGADHVPPGAAGVEVVAVQAAHVHAELGGQHHLVAAALECGAEALLGAAVWGAVDVGGVEQGDSRVERRVHDLAGAVDVELAAEVVAADADDGDGQARIAKPAVAHLTHDPTLCRPGETRRRRPANELLSIRVGQGPVSRAEQVDQRDVPYLHRRRVQRPQQQLRRRADPGRALAQPAQAERRGVEVGQPGRPAAPRRPRAGRSPRPVRACRAGRPAVSRGPGRARPGPGTGRRRRPRPARTAPPSRACRARSSRGSCSGCPAGPGRAADRARSNRSTISCGISPASSAARYSACSPSASVSAVHWASSKAVISIVTAYGCGS